MDITLCGGGNGAESGGVEWAEELLEVGREGERRNEWLVEGQSRWVGDPGGDRGLHQCMNCVCNRWFDGGFCRVWFERVIVWLLKSCGDDGDGSKWSIFLPFVNCDIPF